MPKFDAMVITVTAIPMLADVVGVINASPASAAISGAVVACIRQGRRGYWNWIASVASSSLTGIFLGPWICDHFGFIDNQRLAAFFILGLCGGTVIEVATQIGDRTARRQLGDDPKPAPPTPPAPTEKKESL